MTPHFLFPSHPIRPAAVEDIFADELEAARSAGYSTSLVPDAVMRDGKSLRNIPAGATVVYRGWMLTGDEYTRLARAVADVNACMLTSPQSYLATHHLPNWYPLARGFTPETRVIPLGADWDAELRAIGWEAYFIKDYVKSIKTSRGSILRDPDELSAAVAEMIRIRGEIEGGLCVRRVEPFVADSERRYFVVDGKAYSSDGSDIPVLATEVAGRIASRFFCVDAILRSDGILRIVEIGDGQVSDLVGWSPAAFAAIWGA